MQLANHTTRCRELYLIGPTYSLLSYLLVRLNIEAKVYALALHYAMSL
jgi:hypothetical protein